MTTEPTIMAGQGTYSTVSVRGIGFAPSKRSIISNTVSLQEKLQLEPRFMNDPFLREAQKRWDKIYFDQTYTRESNGTCKRDAKVDHIGDHIAKLLKKVHRAQADEDNYNAFANLTEEAVGDAAIYRTQLANTLGFNLKSRLGHVKTTSSDLSEAKDLLIVALPQDYTEPHEHRSARSSSLRSEVRNVGIPAMHMAHLILANYCEVDPFMSHLERLADKPGIANVN